MGSGLPANQGNHDDERPLSTETERSTNAMTQTSIQASMGSPVCESYSPEKFVSDLTETLISGLQGAGEHQYFRIYQSCSFSLDAVEARRLLTAYGAQIHVGSSMATLRQVFSSFAFKSMIPFITNLAFLHSLHESLHSLLFKDVQSDFATISSETFISVEQSCMSRCRHALWLAHASLRNQSKQDLVFLQVFHLI